MFKVYSSIRGAYNASHFYRIVQPMYFLQKAGLADCILDLPTSDLTEHDRVTAVSYSDINWYYQPIGPNFQLMIESCAEWPGRWDTETEWSAPPSFVMDTDDDLFNIHPTNTGPFTRMGTRINGEELQPGAILTVEDDNGERKPLFEDGKKDFDVARNLETMRQYRHNLNIASLVTCSTWRSEEYVRREAPAANTFVMPNCINLEDYPKVELADKPKVRILWQGSGTHLEDLYPYKDTIREILESNPNVEIVIWGAKYVDKDWPQDQVRFEPWRPYEEYKLRLSMMNHDINLCFLSGDTFGLSRSGIKWYESSGIWKPAATLAPRVGVFGDECEDGITALLYDSQEDFKTKLQGLIDDSVLRKTLAENAKDWVRDNRDPAKWAETLAQIFLGIRAAKKLAWREPPKELVSANSISAEQPDLR